MRRAALLLLAVPLLGGCVYHWPTNREASAGDHEHVGFGEMLLNGAATTLLTLALHEAGHAAMGAAVGADDIEVLFFQDGRPGVTRVEGDFSDAERRLLDMGGVLMTYGAGELFEYLVLDDVVDDDWKPFFATWALLAKTDLYLQTGQSFFDHGSDFSRFSEGTGMPKAAWLGVCGIDMLFHHETYLDLADEATTRRVEPKDADADGKPDEKKDE